MPDAVVGKLSANEPDDRQAIASTGSAAKGGSADSLNLTPFIFTDSRPLSPIVGLHAAVKRLEDILLGSAALLLLCPLMALIALIIKLDSTGPALFCQARSGRNRQIIKVYKFRTMFQNDVTEFKQASKDDPRITRIGAFLRKTSLDELPQLINVIQGSMSLVGPRPHPLKLDEDFKYVIPSLYSRYCVKPGITGWAQINGFRGETRRVSDMISRIEHDRHYIQNWSVYLDLKILFVTTFKGWMHKNAY
ncbi:MAG: exopolysaccharide biosynthesis polyprenyl glycosylphosphotransferase [Granulosicoccus sp.]